jgi:hypothetical protein
MIFASGHSPLLRAWNMREVAGSIPAVPHFVARDSERKYSLAFSCWDFFVACLSPAGFGSLRENEGCGLEAQLAMFQPVCPDAQVMGGCGVPHVCVCALVDGTKGEPRRGQRQRLVATHTYTYRKQLSLVRVQAF